MTSAVQQVDKRLPRMRRRTTWFARRVNRSATSSLGDPAPARVAPRTTRSCSRAGQRHTRCGHPGLRPRQRGTSCGRAARGRSSRSAGGDPRVREAQQERSPRFLIAINQAIIDGLSNQRESVFAGSYLLGCAHRCADRKRAVPDLCGSCPSALNQLVAQTAVAMRVTTAIFLSPVECSLETRPRSRRSAHVLDCAIPQAARHEWGDRAYSWQADQKTDAPPSSGSF